MTICVIIDKDQTKLKLIDVIVNKCKVFLFTHKDIKENSNFQQSIVKNRLSDINMYYFLDNTFNTVYSVENKTNKDIKIELGEGSSIKSYQMTRKSKGRLFFKAETEALVKVCAKTQHREPLTIDGQMTKFVTPGLHYDHSLIVMEIGILQLIMHLIMLHFNFL